MEANTMLKTEPVDDKFFSRPLISKQHSSMINLMRSASLRTGNGSVSAGVPFLWESKPGTPKHLTSPPSSTLFPPLNPPPRTYNTSVPQTPMRLRRRAKSSFALRSLFPVKFLGNKSRHSESDAVVLAPESLSPSSSSSASSSVPSSPVIRPPLAIFRRSHSTSITHNKSVFDYDLYDSDKSASASCGFVRCFGP